MKWMGGGVLLGSGIIILSQVISCGPPPGWECTSPSGGLPCSPGNLCRGPQQLPLGHRETAWVPRCYAVCESTLDCTVSAALACLRENEGDSWGPLRQL